MKKNEKVVVNEKSLIPSDALWQALRAADENDLRLMLALSLLHQNGEHDIDVLKKELELSDSEFEASVKYWCGAGLLKKAKSSSAKNENQPKDEKNYTVEKSTPPTAHKDGLVERKSELPSYSSAELAELIEKRRVTAEFINEAQRITGKMFNTHEVNILVGMVDYIGFDEQSVIIILSHMNKLGKKSLRYAEQLAFSLYDEGITDAEALQARLSKLEESSKIEAAVRSMFGMTGRALTTKEKKFLRSWIDNMGYDIECIRLAYDITVDATQSPAPAYANTILENWFSAGLTTYEQIVAFEDEKKSNKTAEKLKEKSYDTDEFFAEALRRSYEEFSKK